MLVAGPESTATGAAVVCTGAEEMAGATSEDNAGVRDRVILCFVLGLESLRSHSTS
jgi:hypothetical protein